MQKIIIEKPYRFVPPHRGTRWPSLVQRFNLYGIYLRYFEGVQTYEIRHTDRLKKSLDANHGILLAPNHSRMSDPLVMGFLARDAGCHLYAMASWHLFNHGWFKAFAIQLMGGFSINREGMDRKSISTAIDAMTEAERPLVIFPEGSTTRTNDYIHPLLDGITFIARSAAKRREKENLGKTVVHPVAIKYRFDEEIAQAVGPVLTDIEKRMGWRPLDEMPLLDRIQRVGEGLFSLEEIRYSGKACPNESLGTRTSQLIDTILHPLEREWLGQESTGDIIPRVKALRTRMVPDLAEGKLDPQERDRRWNQLEDIYVAQQISCYVPDYLSSYPSVDRILETVQRLEEDLTDRAQIVGALHVIIEVDEPIEVPVERPPKGVADPLLNTIRTRLQSQLDRLGHESPRYG